MNVWVSKHNHAIYFTDDTFATCLQKNCAKNKAKTFKLGNRV